MLGFLKKKAPSVRKRTESEKTIALKDGSLEIPSFMSPEQAREMLQHRLDSAAKQIRAAACINALIVVTPASINAKSRSVHPGDIQYDQNHCQNDRRNGSKFCQKCSDEYKAKLQV